MVPAAGDYVQLGTPSAPATLEPWSFGRKAWIGLGLAAATVGSMVLVHVGLRPQTAVSPPTPTTLVVKDTLGGPGSPLAKQVVVGMDTNINFHTAWNDWKDWSREMAPWWTKDMIYDFNYVGKWGFGPAHGLQAWFDGEHMHINSALPDCQWIDFIRAATNETCTSASYGLGRWVAPFAGVPPPAGKPWVKIHDLDFYLLEGSRIKVNWCLIDVVDLFTQVGYQVLPPAPLPMDGYRAPNCMDGSPAPMSAMVDPRDTLASEKVWRAAVQEDYVLGTGDARWWAEDMVWYGPGGVGIAHSRQEYVTHFLKPLHAGFSNISLQLDLLVCEGKFCGAHFYLHGTHTGEWLGEKATGRRVRVRCGAHAHVRGGKIVEGWLIVDVARAFADMGVDLYGRARNVALSMASA